MQIMSGQFGRMPSLLVALALGIAFPAVAAERNQQVYEGAEQCKDDALKLLERLVNIDSGTGYEKGLNQVNEIVIEELKKVGARVETFPATPAAGNNVVATLTGTGKGRILLIAHSDTVFAEGTAAARPYTVKGARAYGPGVMDDKGGIVAAVCALRILQRMNFKDYARITLMVNTNEETGSTGSRALIEKLGKEHDIALALEPGRPADGLVIWRKGSGIAKVEVKGKSAHAGVAPDSGRNAAMEVAHQVLQLGKLGDKEKQTTVNFTVLKAGERTNVIPDSAVAEADVRVLTVEEFDRVEKDMARISANKLIPDTEVKTSIARNVPPMPRTRSRMLWQRARRLSMASWAASSRSRAAVVRRTRVSLPASARRRWTGSASSAAAFTLRKNTPSSKAWCPGYTCSRGC